jgi:hypothetical protein
MDIRPEGAGMKAAARNCGLSAILPMLPIPPIRVSLPVRQAFSFSAFQNFTVSLGISAFSFENEGQNLG